MGTLRDSRAWLIATGAAIGSASLALLCVYGRLATTIAVVAIATVGLLFVYRPGDNTRTVWWMNPAWAMLLAALPGVVLATVLPEIVFGRDWDTPKYVTLTDAVLYSGLIASFVIGTLGGSSIVRERLGGGDLGDRAWSPAVVATLQRAARLLVGLTIVGYGLWLSIGVARGLRADAILGVLQGGGIVSVKALLRPVGGVTTLTQFGPLAVVVLMLLARAGDPLRRTRGLLWLIFGLSTARAFVNAERIAIMEVAVPAIVLVLAYPHKVRIPRRLVVLAPAFAPVVLLVFFGAFEYFRSWSSPYYQQRYQGRPYVEFVANRLSAYYATAVNNGVLLIANDQRQSAVPFFTARWVWNAPGIGAALDYPSLTGSQPSDDLEATLAARANPEFNNPTGLLLPVYDFGYVGAIAFWSLCGFALGVAYRSFLAGGMFGLLLYPILFLGILESGRILVWTDGRSMPSIVGALILAALVPSIEGARARGDQFGSVGAAAPGATSTSSSAA